MNRDNSHDPTPYAVYCIETFDVRPSGCGLQFLTYAQYSHQLSFSDRRWKCPKCGGEAVWDDYCQETNPTEEQAK